MNDNRILKRKAQQIFEGLSPKMMEDSTLLMQIFEHLLAAVVIIDLEGIVKFVNKKYTQITGISYDEIINKRLIDIRPKAKLPEVVRKGEPLRNYYREEGDQRYFVDLSPIWENGKVIGGVTLMYDYDAVQRLTKQLMLVNQRVDEMKKLILSQHPAQYCFDDIVAKTTQMKETIAFAKRVSAMDSNIMVIGETGTGKELFAHSIHQESYRNRMPFVPINCSAIPSSLIESELFGYEKGSFSGALDTGRMGLFETADGGTLFLDEIECMSLDMQAKLLRALQEKRIRRIGASTYTEVDVRVISATNVPLQEMIKKGEFREDLYYRLCVIPLAIPPLRNRKEDIEELIYLFMKRHNMKYDTHVTISEEAKEVLTNYSWPGNVRELQNAIEFLTNLSENGCIDVANLPVKFIQKSKPSGEYNGPILSLGEEVERTERLVLKRMLNKYGRSTEAKKQIASALGISVATLYNKLRKYDKNSNL